MSTRQYVDDSVRDELLSSIEEDPLNPQTTERVREAIEAGCATTDVARTIYVGLEGVLATYWVALQEGNLQGDDGDFYRVVGMRRYVRTCYEDEGRLAEFLTKEPEFFEMLGRMTSWQH